MERHILSAIKGLWINKWYTIMAILSIGICFFIVTGIFLAIYNLEIFTKNLSTKAGVVIYLKEGATEAEVSSFVEKLKNSGDFSRIQYISKDDALKEMKNLIDPSLLELIGYNPLSDTIECYVKDESLQYIEQIAKKIKTSQLVDDVYYPVKFISVLKTIRITLWNLAISIFSLFALAVCFIIYATVKNFYWKKTEEIEILKLLGATPSYIRFPFIIEGGILGLAGALFTIFFIITIYFILHSRNFADFLPAISRISFPQETFYALPLFGLFLGMLSSFLALGKIKYK